ncbi:hypothetical protein KBB41_03650 [Candidatus Curtissbacteria bacterium]|nr:hypothetical protein [Candidatus Curtissbacteria bacterium]
MRKILLLLLIAMSVEADQLIKDKKGYRFASDRKTKVYFTKSQAVKINSVLSDTREIVIKHRYGKVRVLVNHYKVLSWHEIMSEQDKELAKLFGIN